MPAPLLGGCPRTAPPAIAGRWRPPPSPRPHADRPLPCLPPFPLAAITILNPNPRHPAAVCGHGVSEPDRPGPRLPLLLLPGAPACTGSTCQRCSLPEAHAGLSVYRNRLIAAEAGTHSLLGGALPRPACGRRLFRPPSPPFHTRTHTNCPPPTHACPRCPRQVVTLFLGSFIAGTFANQLNQFINDPRCVCVCGGGVCCARCAEVCMCVCMCMCICWLWCLAGLGSRACWRLSPRRAPSIALANSAPHRCSSSFPPPHFPPLLSSPAAPSSPSLAPAPRRQPSSSSPTS